MRKFKCPFTNKEIPALSVGNYIRYNHDKYSLSKDDFRYELYKSTFGEKICSYASIYDIYVTKLYSITDCMKEFGINSANLFFLLSYHNIPKRSIKESAKLISSSKHKKTCMIRYGVNNVSQVNEIKNKKKSTFIKNYGVDNIWKHADYHKWVDDWFKQKYNLNKSDYVSLKSKQVWKNKTLYEKEIWLSKSIHSDSALVKCHEIPRIGYNSSKLEFRIAQCLDNMMLPYERLYCHKITNKKRYYYDFRLEYLKLIIEVNGDYWHCNPCQYKSDDLVRYKWNNIYARDIWEKDKRKIDTIKNLGYNVLIIWENDIINRNDQDLVEFVKDKINICCPLLKLNQ